MAKTRRKSDWKNREINGSDLCLQHFDKILNIKVNKSIGNGNLKICRNLFERKFVKFHEKWFLFVCLFVTEEILNISYDGGLWLKDLGQAPMLLVFLTPRQTLSSHPCVFNMICGSPWIFIQINNFFQVAGASDQTADPWATSPMLLPTPQGTP